jgi:hypothetical protein
MRPIRRTLAWLLPLVLVTALAGEAIACPNCKEAVSAQPADQAGMAQGYNWSVLFMLGVPFTLLGTGTFMVVRAARNGSLPEL